MDGRPGSLFWGVVLDAPDARELAGFYIRLLGWPVAKDEPGWVAMAPPGSRAYLAFQTEERYRRPAWPAADGEQLMMLHLDLEVGDLAAATALAVAAGATLAGHLPQDDVRVLLDPAGHPFCLYVTADPEAPVVTG